MTASCPTALAVQLVGLRARLAGLRARLAGVATKAATRTTTEHVHVQPWLFATILLVGGIPALLLGVIGWRKAEAIVPTALPETLYWRRYRVIRRGAVAFVVIGIACLVLASYALTVHGFSENVQTKK